jgi:hypothetical protein
MKMQIVILVQTNLNSHYVFRAKQILQIINEDTLDDERAYSDKILLHLGLIRVEQEMTVFQRMRLMLM